MRTTTRFATAAFAASFLFVTASQPSFAQEVDSTAADTTTTSDSTAAGSMMQAADDVAADSTVTDATMPDDAPARYGIHDESRPRPPVIDPGTASTQEEPGTPPSDAIVLFGGEGDLSNWQNREGGGEPNWTIEDGNLVAGSGYIESKQGFGDVQLHVETSAPLPAEGEGQGRGNSGIFLMGQYEIQVLDSYENETYADGQAGAIYGQYPPLANVNREPGAWNMYDIVFQRPRFDEAGVLVEPAQMTVFLNGVLVQNNRTLMGPTAYQQRPPYEAHADKLPLALQDHSNPVRFRNIWVRELE